TALLLLSPYVPLLFMGQEYGEIHPFLYFVSHGDEALIEAVRDGRRREFASFAWQGEVPDPAAVGTFERSRLDRSRASASPHAELLALHRDLLRLRAREAALRPGNAEVRVDCDEAEGWIVMELILRDGREAAGAAALCAVFNLGGEPVRVPLPAAEGATWRAELATESPAYGGTSAFFRGDSSHALVAPYAAELYSQEIA
ncbi:MAG: DUF3459 domain-containing protein, partial [Gemmatimonadota bacterium]|nr:DUF3459 domain-containing protein [Gemmatimonadota bacterium]